VATTHITSITLPYVWMDEDKERGEEYILTTFSSILFSYPSFPNILLKTILKNKF
jgi:hypothetical protein